MDCVHTSKLLFSVFYTFLIGRLQGSCSSAPASPSNGSGRSDVDIYWLNDSLGGCGGESKSKLLEKKKSDGDAA